VTVGFRYLDDDPPEVGLPFQGIARRFVEYRKDNLYIRVGNSSQLYGRGLVLNIFENRGLAYDTWIDGVKASYRVGNLKASIIGGKIEFTDSINVLRTEEYNIRGGNIEYRIIQNAKIGLSFISSEAKIPQFNQSIANTVGEHPEIYLDLNHGPFNIFLNWASLWTKTPSLKNTSTGYGIYTAMSYSGEKFGITLDYKNYRFDLQDPFLRDDETRTTKLMPFQNPPIVMKEHSYTLLSRSIHEINFNDEVGFQIEANYSASDNLNLSINFSMASRLNEYLYDQSSFSFSESKRENNFLPSTDDKFSPYTEIFFEGEYYFDFNTVLRFGAANRKKTLFNEFTGLSGSHIIESTVLPFQFSHPFTPDFSTVIEYEFENVNDNFNTGQEEFYNQFVSMIALFYSKVSFGLRYEFTNNRYDLSGRKDWLITELGYRISGRNLVSVSYGRERGGQVCSNGICRYILPFKGFRVTLQTSI
jgi:hypothetical protein